jgi:hypothetical protein
LHDEKGKYLNEGRIEVIQKLFPLMVERKVQVYYHGET